MILIKNGRILTMTGTVNECGSLLIKDKKIYKIDQELETERSELSETDLDMTLDHCTEGHLIATGILWRFSQRHYSP